MRTFDKYFPMSVQSLVNFNWRFYKTWRYSALHL